LLNIKGSRRLAEEKNVRGETLKIPGPVEPVKEWKERKKKKGERRKEDDFYTFQKILDISRDIFCTFCVLDSDFTVDNMVDTVTA
jgi:hypothetical protein